MPRRWRPRRAAGPAVESVMSRLLKRLMLGLCCLLLLAAAGVWVTLRASLPQLAGEYALAGLRQPASVERDGRGVPTVRGRQPADLARVLGMLHAQDRFFQMDLSRRVAAGELSALVGGAALATDRANRLHRFRALARQRWSAMQGEDRELLAAYAEGVNQGLAGLGSRPFEYWLLGVAPQPWQPEDSMLVLYSMFMQLHDDSGAREAQRIAIREFYPPAMADLLEPAGTPWDAPLLGEPSGPPALPSAQEYDLRPLPLTASKPPPGAEPDEDEPVLGSNNWAVAGWRSGNGRALLANDMHLGIRVPNTWYRARLLLAGELDVTGVTLPGVPGVVVGSNGRVAWGFTNSYGDWVDLVALEFDPQDPQRYRVPGGYEPLQQVTELIEQRGAEPVELVVHGTRWGPVVEFLGRRYALAWTAHHAEASNLGLLRLAQARDVDEALAQANRVGAPPQNFVAADDQGNIGWTIMGRMPRRSGFHGWDAADWSQPGTGWQGWVAPEEYPRIVNPPSGILWTANSRVVEGPALELVGDGGYALGARAGQIRDHLQGLQQPTVADMLAVQLDDRALFLERWRELLLDLLTEQALQEHPQRARFRALVQDWIPRASVDSVGYRLVRGFRHQLQEDVYRSLTAELRSEYPELVIRPSWQFEASLWRLVTEKPANLLESRYASWEQQMLAVVDWLIEDFARRFDEDLSRRNWGERNTARIEHPLAGALPLLGRWLNMPPEPLPGDANMPRVQGMRFGASERFGLSPGRESEGYFHMPGGQSGHPLSPFYSRDHADWAQGTAAGFLPGPGQYRLLLHPAGHNDG